jgi:hypothetical protein
VVLIPCREDYKSSGVHEELWWQPLEYLDFKLDATAEVTAVMKRKNVDIKRAIEILYHSSPPLHLERSLNHLLVGSPLASPTTVSDPSPYESVGSKAINFLSLQHSQTIDPEDS